MGLIYTGISKNINNMTMLHHIFNKNVSIVGNVCDEENVGDMSKRDLDTKSFIPIKLGVNRDIIREEL
jgi:predicted nucleic acid-binding protein